MIDKETTEWLIKAGSDLKIVEHELNLPEEEIVKDAVCFLLSTGSGEIPKSLFNIP